MHKLIEFICDELDELEDKIEKEHKLSAAEVQYGDLLAHFKKNLLTADAMMEDGEYSNANRGNSYVGRYSGRMYNNNARRRGSMGRYSRDGYSMDGEELVSELRALMQDAPDDRTRQEFQRFISKIQAM